ncbi:RES family NAD+ phosphorylase [Marinobacterium mangrovicola]|uniref:RES domain-containing protein n=1 Tax=Marinobacterium mangrovicola TaxID=1476959 RepID=A0A4R1GQE7_9GAMM|nr:RES family NAD+ phosphorylase [Marinobacterium mangrovicola]TCK09225.1 RES domain-containing protein [Marinobacterium mangrovicola]
MQQLIPDWERAHRLVPSHFPPINLFETVADPEDLEIIFEIESLTNDRLRDEAGDLRLVPASERISGPGSTPVMAAFTHIGQASRFTDGRYGVYYAGNSLEVAIAETRYHRERFLSATQEPDTEVTLREYISVIQLPLEDIRGDDYADLHHPSDYAPSQRFALGRRQSGVAGLLYNSVRQKQGECVALFTPKATSIPAQGGHYRYVWSGAAQRIISVLAVSQIQ